MNLKDKKVDLKFCALSPFLVRIKIEQELIDLLLEKGKESQEKRLPDASVRFDYAGGVKEMRSLPAEEYKPWFIQKFSPYLDEYIKGVNDYCKNSFQWKKQPLSIDIPSLWINYQRSSEYIPMHTHDGDLSFVIYLQVPDEIKKEKDEISGENDWLMDFYPGMISFEYGVKLPFTNNSFRYLPNVGDCFIFPSWLTHHVYSFKADVERIAASGNIEFESVYKQIINKE